MNNRGQSLVTFVLIIPIILLILFMVYDIGNMVSLKIELDNINYIAMDYGVDKINTDNIRDKLKEIINKNKKDIDNISITIENDKLNIVLEDKLDNNISIIKNIFTAKSSYTGYMEDNKKRITKG